MADVADLLHQWRVLVGPEHDAAGRELLSRWSEPHRRYHTADHLRRILAAVDELRGHAGDVAAVRLAAWFHDAVYTGRSGPDERASALLAASMLPGLNVPGSRVAEVVRLVELTVSHDPRAGDANGAVLCDADLAILGSQPAAYAAYVAAVRAEHPSVRDEDFRRGRAVVIRGLLALDPLYRTPTGGARWEAAARRNLTAELSDLGVEP